MTDTLALALAQINPTVGDVAGNAGRLRAARVRAAADGADLVVAGELAVSGYPPEDLVLRPIFQDTVRREVEALAAETADGGPALLVGAPWIEDGLLRNAALLLDGGGIAAVRLKHDLPNYGVFDEKRLFAPGPLPGPVNFRDVRIGVMICEDMWTEEVAECLHESGAELLAVLNGSPFEAGKWDTRIGLAVARAAECGLPLVYVNQVGGQDELVFDGSSFAVGADGTLVAAAPPWREELVLTRWRRTGGGWTGEGACRAPPPEGLGGVYAATVLGLRDYVAKNGFPGVIIGLSGGVDSALTAAVAVDPRGPARVGSVKMPSPPTTPATDRPPPRGAGPGGF